MKRWQSLLCCLMLQNLAATIQAQQADSDNSLQGDPFSTGLSGDPFANDKAFQSYSEIISVADNNQESDSNQDLFGLHGHLESRNQLRTGADHKFISTRQRLWLETDGTIQSNKDSTYFEQIRYFASAGLDYDPSAANLSDDHKKLHLHLEESYLTFDSTDLDIVFGRKMLRWGTGDGINPLDLINPVDYRDPIASGRADTRVPVVLGQAIFSLPTFDWLQEASLEAVIVPLAQVNRLNHHGSAWESYALKQLRIAESQGSVVLASQQKPDKYLQDAEFGLRLAMTTQGWDLAMIGFYGHIDSPVFARDLVEDSNETTIRLTPVHPTFYALGINFAKGLERSTIRGELSVKPDYPLMLKDTNAIPGYDRRSMIEGVLGVDHTFGTNLYTNLQYFFTFIDESEDLSRNRFDYGMSYEIHDLFLRDDLKAGIRGVLSFTDDSRIIEPFAEWKLGDDWLLAASLLFFSGSENSRFGQFSDNDMLSLRLRYSF